MSESRVIALFSKLPADATCGDAIDWTKRVRRLLSRWEELPANQTRSMTPEIKQKAFEELAILERLLREQMGVPNSA